MPPEKELQKPESQVSVNVDAYTADDKFSKKKFADGHDTIPEHQPIFCIVIDHIITVGGACRLDEVLHIP